MEDPTGVESTIGCIKVNATTLRTHKKSGAEKPRSIFLTVNASSLLSF
jgi:hypothetical protein